MYNIYIPIAIYYFILYIPRQEKKIRPLDEQLPRVHIILSCIEKKV